MPFLVNSWQNIMNTLTRFKPICRFIKLRYQPAMKNSYTAPHPILQPCPNDMSYAFFTVFKVALPY